METKNVLVVLAGALVLSLIVSLAVVGGFKGTGYAVGDTVRTQNIYEGASKPSTFTLGGVKHTINVLDISENVAFIVDGVKEDTITLLTGQESGIDRDIDLLFTLLYTGKNFFGKEYAVFQVTEVDFVEVQPVPSGEGIVFVTPTINDFSYYLNRNIPEWAIDGWFGDNPINTRNSEEFCKMKGYKGCVAGVLYTTTGIYKGKNCNGTDHLLSTVMTQLISCNESISSFEVFQECFIMGGGYLGESEASIKRYLDDYASAAFCYN